MNKMAVGMVLMVVVLIFLVACESGTKAEGPLVSEPSETSASNVSFWHDDERSVSCWIYDRAAFKKGMGGISCIPDYMLGADR